MSTYAASAKQYAERVVSHEILTCEWVQKACKRQLDDLIRFKRKSSLFQFNPELLDRYGRPYRPADNLCAFIERLPHVKGPLASKMIVLEPWQVFILSTVFGWVKSDGKRRFRRSYIEVPRGNAKSTLSSAVGLYMLAADREGGAEVYSLATTRDQARIVFGDAQTMARLSPGFRNRFAVNVGAHNMHVLQTGSKFEALSAEGSTLDGLNIHFGCIDELHAHKTRTVYDVVETGTGKRDNSLLWVITTAGSNRSGICYEVRSFVTKLLNRVFEDDSQFGIIYGLDDGDDWAAKDSLIKANPNWGISVREEILVPLQAKAMQLPSAVNNFKTKHLNEWVSADTAWMDMRSWDASANPDLELDQFLGQPCWLGLDLASKTDIAALVMVFEHPDTPDAYAVFGKYYLPEDTVQAAGNSQYEGWAHTGRLSVTPGTWQYFSGNEYFEHQWPCDPTQLGRFRKALGEEGVEELLARTMEVAVTLKLIAKKELTRVIVDSRVQEKAIAHPTDSKLLETARSKVVEVAKDNGIELKQTYAKEGQLLGYKAGRYAHARQFKRMRKVIKRQRTIVARLQREVGRKMTALSQAVQETLGQTLDKAKRLVAQTASRKAVDNRAKLYSWHVPEVECISKGKSRNPYEFGVKVGLAMTLKGNLIVGARSFPGNPYDGHTMHEQIEQSAILMQGLGVKPVVVYADLGYRGVDKDNPQIEIKHRGKDKRLTDEERRLLKRRQAIEPIIGHLKADHRMDRCHLKGSEGDALHAVLCAAGYNIRWLLRMIIKKGLGLLLCLLQASGLTEMFEILAKIFGRHRVQNSDQRWVLA